MVCCYIIFVFDCDIVVVMVLCFYAMLLCFYYCYVFIVMCKLVYMGARIRVQVTIYRRLWTNSKPTIYIVTRMRPLTDGMSVLFTW